MPGFIDFKKGINYTYLDSDEKTITQYLSEKLGMPVYIDNDSSLIALAEFRFGAARNQQERNGIKYWVGNWFGDDIEWRTCSGVIMGLPVSSAIYRFLTTIHYVHAVKQVALKRKHHCWWLLKKRSKV